MGGWNDWKTSLITNDKGVAFFAPELTGAPCAEGSDLSLKPQQITALVKCIKEKQSSEKIMIGSKSGFLVKTVGPEEEAILCGFGKDHMFLATVAGGKYLLIATFLKSQPANECSNHFLKIREALSKS